MFVCAHGAGSHKDHPAMQRLAAALETQGLDVVRFDFPYRERGSRAPDPMPVLTRRIAEVAARVRGARRLLLGGRSMGGRAASMLAAEGFACDGLLLFGYPLHPAGKPERLRDAHLPQIRVPVFCMNGTRDALCRRALMERALQTVRTRWEMHWVAGAGHAFDLDEAAAAAVRDWVARLG